MSDLKVKLLLEAIDRVTKPIGRMTRRISDFASKTNTALRQIGAATKNLGDRVNKVGQAMTLRLTTALGGIGFMSLNTAGDIEKLNIKFGSLLGSTEKAKNLVAELVDFTSRTPFQLRGVADTSTKLLTAGVATSELADKLSILGDIAALADADLSELGTIYSRVKSAQVAYTMELEMLSDRGIPIWQELSKITGKSIREIRKATANGVITFDLFEQALKNMREEGGVAFEQMQKQSWGWHGLLSTLRDNINLGFAAIGESAIKNLQLKEFVSDIIKTIQDLVTAFNKLPEPMQGFILKAGVVLALLGPLLMGFGQLAIGLGITMIGFAKLGTGIAIFSGFMTKTLIPSLWGATLAVGRLSIAFLATPIGWITLGIAALAVAGYLIIKHWKKVKEFWSNLWDGITSRVRAAADYINPIIKKISEGVSLLTDNAITRGVGRAVDFVSGGSGRDKAPLTINNGLSGKIEIKVDAEGRPHVKAAMANRGVTTEVNQGILMGAPL